MKSIDKKYQVFVSSTFEDLKEERQEVIHALLELDCIPSGMELFPAADEDQWSLIKGVISECDYYVLILGGRYGTIGPDDVGYTEKEYRYALEIGKPIIAFLHKDPDSLPKKKTEKTDAGQRKFSEFRSLIQKKMCKFWETPQELGSVVSRSLISLERKHPGIGWVRGDLVPDKDSALEILDLRKQIENLQKKLGDVRTQAPPGSENLAQGEEVYEINYTCSSEDENDVDYDWNQTISISWNDIFYHISPLMINEEGDYNIKEELHGLVKNYGFEKIKKNKDAKGHRFSGFRISDHDFHNIKVQLRALGLIKKSEKSRSVKDTETYWTLTPYGDSIMNQLRAIKKDEK